MAARLLLVILINLFYELKSDALQPSLTVDRLLMRESDSVTLNCLTPSYVSGSGCDFYIQNQKIYDSFSCAQTLTGSEVLKMVNRRSPTEVKVRCRYRWRYGTDEYKSSDSDPTFITISNLLPPDLTANQSVITETDSVMLTCQTPSSVPVPECFLFSMSSKTSKLISCMQTLTGTELLSLSHQSSPAEVQLSCYFTTEQRGGRHQSLHSSATSVRIRGVKTDPTLLTTPAIDVTTGLAVSTQTRNNDGFFSASSKPASDTTDFTTTGRGSSISASQDSGVILPASAYPVTLVAPNTEPKLHKSFKQILIAGPGFGVALGVVLLGGALLCYGRRRRDGKNIFKRSQVNFTANTIGPTTLNNGGLFCADDSCHMINHVPAADSPPDFMQPNRRESNNENSDIYHVYATLNEEPAATPLRETAYHIIQEHLRPI
ncbi:uncharacterized protein [Nothobranchius furzeri]|uniref:uncharacterized protein isoform X2 n=1 Tax=Nothobranchius furzeri TaxID=105023 RepID=UPI003904B71C